MNEHSDSHEREMDSADPAQRKLIAEALKSEHEARKISAEADETELRVQQLRRGWLAPRIVIQSAFAGIIVAGLLAAWGIGYLQPILTANSQLADIETQILEKENKDLEKEKKDLEKEKKDLASRRNELDRTVEELKRDNAQFKATLDLAEKSAKERLEQLRETSVEATGLKEQIQELRKASGEAKNRVNKLIQLQLGSYRIFIQEEYFEQDEGARIAEMLRTHGFAPERRYVRSGGNDRVVWVKPHVVPEARDRLLELLGGDWSVSDSQPHEIILREDWDIVLSPAPPTR